LGARYSNRGSVRRAADLRNPVDIAFPTISAPDLGSVAADLLLRPATRKDLEIAHAEGPAPVER
jgi:hypothetical protein